jgi:DUF3047 family protein
VNRWPILAPILLAAVVSRAAGPSSITVEDWSRQPEGKVGVPDGWKPQNWGSPKCDFAVVVEGGAKILHLRSQNDNSIISKEVRIDVRQFPILEWRWKVVALPAGADARRKETDDQAAQIYVTFPRFPSAIRSRIIGYIWDSTAPVDAVIPIQSGRSPVTYVVVRSGEIDVGRWITERRDVYRDYIRIYGEEFTEEARAISVAIDSNDTHSRAESYVGEIRFLRP